MEKSLMGGEGVFRDRQGIEDVRSSNFLAAKAVSDAVRSSLGPKGMDKMIIDGSGEVIVTNDGATILDRIDVTHPCARMLVQLSKAQDTATGDGTTSVTIIAGSLLGKCHDLLTIGIHPMVISRCFEECLQESLKVLNDMAIDTSLHNKPMLIKAAATSLCSKVVAQHREQLARIAVESVLCIVDGTEEDNTCNLSNIKVVKKLGGTIQDMKQIPGVLFSQGASGTGPKGMKNCRIAFVQFCLSPPKPDLDSQIIVKDVKQIDRIVKEEKKYLRNLVLKIAKAGVNVLIVQKSILRDDVHAFVYDLLRAKKIVLIKGVDRNDGEFLSKAFGCVPCASIDALTPDKLGSADSLEEIITGSGEKYVQVTGIPNPGGVTSILCHASSTVVLDEVERSLHDALCVVRSIVKKRKLITGGGSPEIRIAEHIRKWADTIEGKESLCAKAFAEAMEIIPFTLAENAGLNAIDIVTKLKQRHRNGDKTFGINVRLNDVTDMVVEDVIQPLLVSESAVRFATECVRMILKIDDIVLTY